MKVPSVVCLCVHPPHGPGVVTAAQKESKWSYRAVRLGPVKWKGESSAAKWAQDYPKSGGKWECNGITLIISWDADSLKAAIKKKVVKKLTEEIKQNAKNI